MRFRPPEIFLGCFLTVAVFAMGMVFESSRRPPAQQPAAANAAKENPTHPPERSIWNWLTHDAAGFFTLWLVIVGGAQIGLFYWQLRLIKVAADDAKRAGISAERAAKATEDAVELSRKTAERQLRAYVGTESVGFVETIGPFKIQIRIVVKNYGVTPAYGYQADIRLSVRENPLTSTFVSHPTYFAAKVGDTLMPGNTSIIICELSAVEQPRALQIYNDALAEKSALYVSGQIIYKDAFGYSHRTSIRKIGRGHRMVEKGGSPFIEAEEGNDSN